MDTIKLRRWKMIGHAFGKKRKVAQYNNIRYDRKEKRHQDNLEN